jgi:glycosyltransferase involved in cell wall biosynthesis
MSLVGISFMATKIFIHAVNVHQGGGRKLLEGLLGALSGDEHEYIFTLDERMPLLLTHQSNVSIRRIKPSLFQRFMAEVWLLRTVQYGDCVLCFGNLPPMFRLKAFTSVYLQNRYLIDRVSLSGFSVWTQLRIVVERLWLSYAKFNANEYLVQTPSMQNIMNTLCRGRVSVTVLPFAVITSPVAMLAQDVRLSKSGFIYVASGEIHKNHKKLIEAWCLLAKENIFPRLVLTLDKNAFSQLCHWIDEKVKEHNLSLVNLGVLNTKEIFEAYDKSEALIYPSTFESLGLPLIEAQQAGIPILASELDFVRDLVRPLQTFDPASAISISRAVKRFMDVEEVSLPISSPFDVMHHLLNRHN